jgi:hypothetical protein
VAEEESFLKASEVELENQSKEEEEVVQDVGLLLNQLLKKEKEQCLAEVALLRVIIVRRLIPISIE